MQFSGERQFAGWRVISLLARVVRYSIRLQSSSCNTDIPEGRYRMRPGAGRTRERPLHRAGGNRCPASRSGFDRIAGLSELFRMGVWRLSRTSRTTPYWSGRIKS
ncbi:hypothetical protein PTKU46_06040 [Paraburkholderia terrae]|nr:hypothetical protein PTKU15_05820 [Paraburkholderia terrae]